MNIDSYLSNFVNSDENINELLEKIIDITASQILILYDKNRIPLRVQADLLVGSIKADLERFSGIANPLEIEINN